MEKRGYWAKGFALQHDWWDGSAWSPDPSHAAPVTCQEVAGTFTYAPPKPAPDAWFITQLPRRISADILVSPPRDFGYIVEGGRLYSQALARAMTNSGQPACSAYKEE